MVNAFSQKYNLFHIKATLHDRSTTVIETNLYDGVGK